MQPHKRAAQLRRRVAYLKALLDGGEEPANGGPGSATSSKENLTPHSERLQTWREELEAQGYVKDELNDALIGDEDWFKSEKRAPDEILRELTSELPGAEQAEEEQRIADARRARGEPSWDLPMVLAWMRFRDVEQTCRFLESRDALRSLWRDGLETDELLERLASGELRCTGVRAGAREEISPADWASSSRDGLRLMRGWPEPSAQRTGDKPLYTELRFQRQAVQYAFPERQSGTKLKDGEILAAARNYLRRTEGKVTWETLWSHVCEELGGAITDTQKERLQRTLREEFPDRINRGRPKGSKTRLD